MRKIIILFISLIFLSACSESTLEKKSKVTLGTFVEISVADRDISGQFIDQATEKAFLEIERVEDLLSKFKPDSDISRVNAERNERPTKVHAETIALMDKSIFFSKLTDGAFDITISPLMEAWNFTGKRNKHRPSADRLKRVLTKVDYRKIKIRKEEQDVFLSQRGMKLDLGAIAKGYAVDKAINVLRQEGIRNALINAEEISTPWVEEVKMKNGELPFSTRAG